MRIAYPVGLVAMLMASPAPAQTGDSGRYPATIEADPTLPGHIVYRPTDLGALGKRKLGIVIWGNGGCTDDAASARLFLSEIAAHGYLVIATGRILSGPSVPAGAPKPTFMTTDVGGMKAALDWAIAANGRKDSPYRGRIDTNAIAVSGHSCGGILSLQLAPDPRIKAVVLHNSGVFPNHPQRPTLITDPAMTNGLHTPILYVVGNATDVAYPVAQSDFARIDHVPVTLASLQRVGHGGTFAEPDGGVAARVTVDWLDWQLRGDKQAGKTFAGPDCGLCKDPGWKVQRKNW